MESIFDLEHPYKTYFKMTLPSVLAVLMLLFRTPLLAANRDILTGSREASR